MLLLAIVSLQFILLQYSCARFVLTKKLYIYIYISSCKWTQGLAKNSTQKLWSCKNNVIRTTHANTI